MIPSAFTSLNLISPGAALTCLGEAATSAASLKIPAVSYAKISPIDLPTSVLEAAP